MRKTSSIVLAALLTLGGATAASSPAFAGQPGPGDKQCAPGQHGNPHPGFKAGACSNR